MKKFKSFLSFFMTIALLMSTVVVPASAAEVPTLTVTPSVEEIDKGTGTADVIYTIQLTLMVQMLLRCSLPWMHLKG